MTKQVKDAHSALKQFEDAASNHAKATEEGNYKLANKSYALISRSVSFLKEKNEMLELLSFLHHPSVGVRIWAATYLLPIREPEAIEALERASGVGGILSLGAETTLTEWKKGNLKNL